MLKLCSSLFDAGGAWATTTSGSPVDITLESKPEDFVVEEIDAYPASGEGEHLFVRIQKRNLPTMVVAKRIAEVCDLPIGAVGFAGRKDARGLTTQRFSVPRAAQSRLPKIEDSQLKILEMHAHRNKLRMGHLKGNYFILQLSTIETSSYSEIQKRFDLVKQNGMANYFGPQRFGRDFATVKAALARLEQRSGRRGERRRRDFEISALQSLLFNDLLGRRISEKLLDHVMMGDILKTQRGGLFVCEDPIEDQKRLNEREITLTGPLFGAKVMTASGTALTWESEILDRRELPREVFSQGALKAPGTRRRLVVYPDKMELCLSSQSTRLSFSLPAGSYATELCRHIFKHTVI